MRALLRLPTNLKDVSTLSGFFDGILALGISTDDLKFFLGKLWEFLTASEARRVAVYDNMTWWDFMEADSKERSQAFRDYLVVAATRSTVAANPRQASAYTIAKMAIQSLIDAATPVTPADRVLNGPTQEVFTNPWVEYLREQGVTFHLNAELESIEFHHSRSEIKHLKLSFNGQKVREAKIRGEAAARRYDAGLARLRALGEPQADPSGGPDDGKKTDDEIEAALHAILVDGDGSTGATPWTDKFARRGPAAKDVAAFGKDVATCGRWSRWYFERYEKAVQDAQAAGRKPVTADYYVLALPIEQMAYQVQISEAMRRIDPSLTNIIRLSEHVDWMAGIQFYLTEKLELTRGHIACLDSPWQLTAIEQVQFWPDVDIEHRNKKRVKAILVGRYLGMG